MESFYIGLKNFYTLNSCDVCDKYEVCEGARGSNKRNTGFTCSSFLFFSTFPFSLHGPFDHHEKLILKCPLFVFFVINKKDDAHSSLSSAKLEMKFEKGQMIKSMALVALVDNYLEASIQPQPPYSASSTDR